jgi:ABC-type sulfate/molybdate transport systems ATPase subunit
VQANVELGLQLRSFPKRERHTRAHEWLQRFDVAHLAERSARALSGGEVQRVALARALAFEPEIVLLDEPFTELDQPAREALVGATMAELRRLGCTTVFVTHDRQEALAVADRVLVLVDGRIRQLGSPAEVQAQPVDAVVAAYIGAPVSSDPAIMPSQ